MRLTLFLSVFGMLLTSCCKEPSTPAKVETPEFRWKIDSVNYQPCEPYYGGAFEPYYVTSQYYSDSVYQLNLWFNYPNVSSNCLPQLVLVIPLAEKGVIHIDINYGGFLGGGVDSNNQALPSYFPDTNDVFNQIEITRNALDFERSPGWITGTFQFKAFNENDSNDSIIITEGYFNHDLSY